MIEEEEEDINRICMNCLDFEPKSYNYSILVMLNKPSNKEMFMRLRLSADYMIFTEESASEIFHHYGNEFFPDCLIGECDLLSPDVKVLCIKKKVKMINKTDTETSDLDKTLYYCLEKISSEKNFNTVSTTDEQEEIEKTCVIVYIDSEKRLDLILATYNEIFKHINTYKKELVDIDILIMSNSSISVFLEEGENLIYTSQTWENKVTGYSIISLIGDAHVQVYEMNENSEEFVLVGEKTIKFGSSFFFRKGTKAKQIHIFATFHDFCSLIYSVTSVFHK